VPTWLYQAVHLTGPVRKMSDGELGPHLDMLSAKFESWLAPKPPWTSSKMTAARLDALKKAIVGLVMTVEDVEGSFKLNQHKSDVDHVAVSDALALQADTGALQLARTMRALRPQLFDVQTTPLNAKAFSSEVGTGSREENASDNNLGSSMPEGSVS
jgi:transcriptional regulator